jgi:hypothetical protein
MEYRQKYGLPPATSLSPNLNLTSPLAENRDEDVLNDLREHSFFRKQIKKNKIKAEKAARKDK